MSFVGAKRWDAKHAAVYNASERRSSRDRREVYQCVCCAGMDGYARENLYLYFSSLVLKPTRRLN